MTKNILQYLALFISVFVITVPSESAMHIVNFDCWHANTCFGGSSTPVTWTTTNDPAWTPTCAFQDTVPLSADIKTWSFEFKPVDCAGLNWENNTINMTVKLNGVDLGTRVFGTGNSVSCACAIFGYSTYTFRVPQFGFSSGLPPGWNRGGTNQIEVTWTTGDGSNEVIALDSGLFRFFDDTPVVENFIFPAAGVTAPNLNKVLISKEGPGDYPEPLYQEDDGMIKVQAKVKRCANCSPGEGVQGANVYFRIKTPDPDDLSSYETDTQNNDNKGGAAALANADSNGIAVGVSQRVGLDDGVAEAVLQLPGYGTNSNTPHATAGDNYQVEASLTPDFSSGVVISGNINVWKRIYVEQDNMFKKGGLLFLPYGAQGFCGGANQPLCCGTGPGQSGLECNKLKLFPGANVKAGNSIRIFDEVTNEAMGESRTIANGNQAVVTNSDGTITVTLTAAPLRSYWASLSTAGSNPTPTFDNLHSGGVGVEGSGRYEGNAGSLSQAFDEALVEFVTTVTPTSNGTNGDLPYLSPSFFDHSNATRRTAIVRFGRTWFAACLQGSVYNCLNNNNFHLLGIEASAGTNPAWGNAYDTNNHHSFVAIKTIETAKCNPDANCKMFTTTHEIAHQFRLNTCNCDYHDQNSAWCAGISCGAADQRCIMSSIIDAQTKSQRQDGIDRFDLQDLVDGWPINQNVVCGSETRVCTVGIGAIRTAPDPQ